MYVIKINGNKSYTINTLIGQFINMISLERQCWFIWGFLV